MFDVPFLIAIKKYTWILWYLLAFIPIVNFVFLIVFKLYMGSKGRSLATTSDHFTNKDELNGFMKGLDHAGKITFFAGLIVLGTLLIFSLLGITSFMRWGSQIPFGNMMK